MKIEQARQILDTIATRRQQWGKHYSVATDPDYSGEDVIMAADMVMKDTMSNVAETAEGTKKVQRQLNAALARESKLRRENEALRLMIDEFAPQFSVDVRLKETKDRLRKASERE